MPFYAFVSVDCGRLAVAAITYGDSKFVYIIVFVRYLIFAKYFSILVCVCECLCEVQQYSHRQTYRHRDRSKQQRPTDFIWLSTKIIRLFVCLIKLYTFLYENESELRPPVV